MDYTLLILPILRVLPLIWLQVAVPTLCIGGVIATGMKYKSTGESTDWVMPGQGEMGLRSLILVGQMQVWRCISFL